MSKTSRRSCNSCSPYLFKIQEFTCKAPGEEIYLQKSRLQQNIQINKNDKNINSINCNWINICVITLRLKADHMEDWGAGNRREKIYRSGWGNQLKWEIAMRGNSNLHIFTLLFLDAVFSLAPTFKCKTKVSERYRHSYFLKLDLGRKFF